MTMWLLNADLHTRQSAAQLALERTGQQRRGLDVQQSAAQLPLEPPLEEAAKFRTHGKARLI